jgi:hypothetical protein
VEVFSTGRGSGWGSEKTGTENLQGIHTEGKLLPDLFQIQKMAQFCEHE